MLKVIIFLLSLGVSMAVSAASKREYEIYGTDNEGDLCLFPRDVSQATFAQMTNYRSKIISSDNYDAFPYATKIGNSIVGIYSTGNTHAQSDKQVMFRSDDNGLTFTTADFFINDTQAFYTGLLSDLLTDGQSVALKAWNLKKVGSNIVETTNSTITGNGKTYAVWSRPISYGGKLYRTGYATVGTDQETALLESSNGGTTWVYKSTIAAITGKRFNECDIVNTTGTNWIAYIREDTGTSDNLYKSTSSDGGATWTTPALVDTKSMNGRQPNLTKLSDGSIILATGDRSGTSGYAGSGDVVHGTDTTGITIFRSTDNGVTWSYRTRVSPMYSTDGGQPFVVDLGNNNIFIVWYARKTTKSKPSIVSCTLNVSNI